MCIITFILGFLLSACMAGLEGMGAGVDPGPLNTQLDAEVWHLNNQYKSVVNWDAIDAAHFYRLYWTGGIQLQDLQGVATLETPDELEQYMESLGYDVSSGIDDIASDTTAHEQLGLTTGVGYCYVVTGITGGDQDAEGVGHSNIDCVVPIASPSVTAQAGSGQVMVSWEPVEGASKYYVWRSEYAASPSVSKQVNLDVAKQIPPATVCASLPPDELVGETTTTSLPDLDVSNCPIYCYTVIPESGGGKIMQGDTQWDIALPEPDGTIENVWVFDSLSGPFHGVAVTENDNIIVSHDSGLVIKYAWDGSTIWETDLTQTHNLVTTDALKLFEDSVYVAVSLGTSVLNSVPGVCKLSIGEGALDPNFGDEGCAGSLITSAAVTDIAVQSDGKVLISADKVGVMEVYTSTFACRFLTNGDIDSTFGGGGGKLGGGASGCYAHLSLAAHPESAHGITVYSDGDEEKSALVGKRYTDAGWKGLVILLNGSGGEIEIDDASVSGQFKSVMVAADGSLLVAGVLASNGIVANYGVSPLTVIDSAVYGDAAKGSAIGTDCRDKPVIGGSFDGDIAGVWRIGDLDDLTSLLLDDGFNADGMLPLHQHLGATDETYGFAYSPNSGNYVFVGVLDALERWKPFIAIVH